MKIAIHHRPGSFSDRWISYCEKEGIAYKLVNVFDNDIINKVKDCDVFMWHHHHGIYKDVLTADRILYSLEHAGVKVFPDWKTAWHFDDKVAQKYLLEAIGAPMVPSYVFYDKQEALDWVEQTDFPKVWKLKGGAGAANVKLIKTKKEAKTYIKQAFGKGFNQFNRWSYLKERYSRFKSGRDSIIGVIKGLGRLIIPTEFSKLQAKEKGYIYFQDFIRQNQFDIRVIVVGKRAFALKRMTRENDFRASGSGRIIYDINQIDENCVKTAFQVNKKIKSQCIAFDFVFDSENNPLIVEISYGFSVEPYDNCEGYWDEHMRWKGGHFNPQEWMIGELIKNTIV